MAALGSGLPQVQSSAGRWPRATTPTDMRHIATMRRRPITPLHPLSTRRHATMPRQPIIRRAAIIIAAAATSTIRPGETEEYGLSIAAGGALWPRQLLLPVRRGSFAC